MNPEISQEGGVASMGKQLHFHQLNHNTTNVRGCDREQAVFNDDCPPVTILGYASGEATQEENKRKWHCMKAKRKKKKKKNLVNLECAHWISMGRGGQRPPQHLTLTCHALKLLL